MSDERLPSPAPYRNERGRAEPPAAGNELDTLLGELERVRATFVWKCGGLDPAGLMARVGVSTMTLGGLLKHLALVEHHTFGTKLLGQPLPSPFDVVDFEADPNWEFESAAHDSPEALMTLWTTAVDESRRTVAAALAAGGLDTPAVVSWPDGRSPSLRRLIVDMVEEYARHTGHADLIRESVDGRTGEDAPDPVG
jgi:hypothetical protein